jgi:NADH dehydrogenase FAD-containing subunit
MKELLLLGAEHAHLKVLKAIAQDAMASTRVTLVHPFGHAVLPSMAASVVSGRLQDADIRCALAPLAQAAHVQFIEAAPQSLDLAARRVVLDNGQACTFDTLSLDLGHTLNREALPGARRHALFLHPLGRFLPLWDSTAELADRRALNIVVIGGDVAGVEMALAVAQRLGARARVALVAGDPGPLPALPERAGAVALRLLKRAGVTVFKDHCTGITESHVLLAQGPRLACDVPLLADVPGTTPQPAWLTSSGLALDEAGRIVVNGALQSTSHPHVFALGPTVQRPGLAAEARGFELDEVAQAADTLAFNLRRATAGGEMQNWHPRARAGQFIDCGQGRAMWVWGGMVFHGRTLRHWKRHRDSRAWAELQVRPAPDWPSTARAPLDTPRSEVARAEADHDR